ncbi:MAG: hypothetical protein V1895_03520 [Parcubacteria group bacterium]
MAKAKSAKKKSETASAIGVYAKIWIAIEAAVLSKGGTHNDLYSLSEAKGATLIDKFADLVIAAKDGSKKVAKQAVNTMVGYLQRLIDKCNFSSVWSGVNETNYPPPRKPVSDQLEYEEFEIDHPMDRAEISEAMGKKDLRIASPYELVKAAAKDPKLGTDHSVIALGQYFAVSDGNLCFAFIYPRGGGRRGLSRCWVGSLERRWDVDYRFLAVRKSSDQALVA